MLKNKKTKQFLFCLAACSASFFMSQAVQASTETVHNATELSNMFSNISEDTTINLAEDFVASGTVNLAKRANYNVLIDGDAVANLSNKFAVTTNTGGDVTFDNMKFNGVDRSSIGINVTGSEGDVYVKNSTFENSAGTAIVSSGATSTTGGKIIIENSLFEKNKSSSGGTLVLSNYRSVILKGSSVIENSNTSMGYYGGAISSKFFNGSLTIENTKFIKNKSTGAGAVLSGGGAIYMYKNGSGSKFEVKQSYFEGNETNLAVSGNTSLDGGAVVIFDYHKNSTVNIDSTTFYNNKAGDDGGALLLQAEGVNEKTYITNSTFYKNIAFSKGQDDYSGGAIQLYGIKGSEENPIFRDAEGGVDLISTNNTFYKNESLAPLAGQEQKGGGIAAAGYIAPSAFESSLLLGNIVEKNGVVNETSLNKNVFVDEFSTQSNTLGFDNGVAITNTAEEAYGKYPLVFGINQGIIKAGYSEDEEIIPTLPIAPKVVDKNDKVILGIANETGAGDTVLDQRGYQRLGKKDIGAIEIASTIYYANTGQFNLDELKEYNGTKYYEGNKPEYYANIATPGYTEKIINAVTVLNPTKTGYDFLGWSTNKNATTADTAYQTNSNHRVEDQLILYAVWGKEENKSVKEIIIYHGNGNTSGVAPKQNSVEKGTEITIKGKGTLKNKGYKFAGWSKKSVITKSDASISPGKKVKVLQKTNFYAVWTR